MILIIDFGSQFNQLIARRVREHNVYCQVDPPAVVDVDYVKKLNPAKDFMNGNLKKINNVYIIIHSKILRETFKSEITNFYQKHYNQRKIKISSKLDGDKDVFFHIIMDNSLKKLTEMSNKQVKSIFDNTLVVIDESHNFRQTKKDDSKEIYKQLWRLAHLADGIKVQSNKGCWLS